MSADPRPGGEPEQVGTEGGAAPARRPRLSEPTLAALGLADDEGSSLLAELAVPEPLPVRRRRSAPPLASVPAGPELRDGADVAVPTARLAPSPDDEDRTGTEFEEGVQVEPARPSRRARRRAARLEARLVRRVIRRIEPWSVLKVGLLFNLSLWLVVTVAGVILWQAAARAGLIDNVESFVAELLAEEEFVIDGPQVFRASALAGVILVFAGTALLVLLAVLFNLISDITGGIRMSVIEVETARPASDRRRGPGVGRRARRSRGTE
jgi:hypothetical protein